MRILLLLLLLVSYSTSNSQTKTTKNLIASCCTESRGCNGSAYCRACKNCTGCKHCAKNGGTCGVCSTQYTKTYSSKNTHSKTTYVKGDDVYVLSKTLNLREKPNSKSKIIETLSKNTILEFLKVSGSWLKVKVLETNTIGYVYAKYIKPKK
ncbi:MAG: SH3 domain-containing protein [Polaribacter sp.]